MGNMTELSRRAPLAVVVMGVSGSGKTTVSIALAEALGSPRLEGDAFHAPQSVAKMASGTPLTDEDRWPWLDRLAHGVDAAVKEHGFVIATCSALKRIYRDRLRAVIEAPVHFVLLDAGQSELSRRLSSRSGHFMPAKLLSSQIATLEYPAPDEGVLTLNAEQSPAALRDAIIAWLESGPG